MATVDEIAALRRATALVGDASYSDEMLSALIDTEGFDMAASLLWRERAASAATLVDTTESGSSRRLSQLYAQSLAMSRAFDPDGATDDSGAGTFTVGIERI